MKLLTLNCHAWQEENQLEKIQHLAQAIKANNYDIICLQEVSQLIDETSTEFVKKDNYAVVLLSELLKLGVSDYQFHWDFAHIGFDIYEEGLAILTKYKINKATSHFITNGSDPSYYKTRKIVGLELSVEDQAIDVYSCHCGWWSDVEEPFKVQIDNLYGILNPDHLNIVVGDFNNSAFVRDEGYDYILSKGLMDTFDLAKTKDDGITVKGNIDGWSKNKDDLRLDLVLVDRLIEIESSHVIFDNKNKQIVSDHFGVEVTFKL